MDLLAKNIGGLCYLSQINVNAYQFITKDL